MDSVVDDLAASRDGEDGPPQIPLALALGVTGHRPEQLDGQSDRIAARLGELFDAIQAALAKVAQGHAELFAAGDPHVRLVTPLAEGADQIAARAALDKGMVIEAALPFDRVTYEGDFSTSLARDMFQAFLGEARSVLELPGRRDAPLAAYVMAGRATIAHCDLLIAIWDGQAPRGRGGTGEVVEIALLNGTPILHVPIDPEAPVRLLWSGFDPHVCTTRENAHAAAMPFTDQALERVIDSILLPPENPNERGFIRAYYGERERRLNMRLEYPLLLALTGVKRLRLSAFRAPAMTTAMDGEWQSFRAACSSDSGISAAIDMLQRGYCWSDQLAQRFAQTYRSGHVFNFLVGAVAVLTALAGLVIPQAKVWLASAELAMIAAIIGNTHVGVKRGWHRRWLDYRQLAERLRPMRSLKLLGIAAPRTELACSGQGRRWTEWYAAGMWRAMGCPHGVISDPARLAKASGDHELDPQIAYHRAAAHSAESLDHRLHMIGLALFSATVIGCLVLIVGLFVTPDWIAEHSKLFVILSAGLPAVGTAIFGIRVQGDFVGTAQRSLSTAARLEEIAGEARAATDLPRAADLLEEAARAMLADLAEWQIAHQQRQLVIPG